MMTSRSIARFSASVAPPVKITRPPPGNSAATSSRAASRRIAQSLRSLADDHDGDDVEQVRGPGRGRGGVEPGGDDQTGHRGQQPGGDVDGVDAAPFSGDVRIASQARDRLGKLIGVGVVTLLFSHVFINIGMNIRMMPVTGVPLPLLSYGGSSVLVSLIAMGLFDVHAHLTHPTRRTC